MISAQKNPIVRQCFREIKLENIKDTDWKLWDQGNCSFWNYKGLKLGESRGMERKIQLDSVPNWWGRRRRQWWFAGVSLRVMVISLTGIQSALIYSQFRMLNISANFWNSPSFFILVTFVKSSFSSYLIPPQSFFRWCTVFKSQSGTHYVVFHMPTSL